jgi:hypothetical protein
LLILASAAQADTCGRGLCDRLVLAQAGSNQDKPFSGDSAPRRQPAPARESHPARAHEARPATSARSNPFDGTWTGGSAGETCPETTKGAILISNGKISGNGVEGHVNSDGSVRFIANGSGFFATGGGHFSRNSASGRFKRNDGCVGHWWLTRQ